MRAHPWTQVTMKKSEDAMIDYDRDSIVASRRKGGVVDEGADRFVVGGDLEQRYTGEGGAYDY